MPSVIRTLCDRIEAHPALDVLARLSFAIERDMHVAMLGGAKYADLKDRLAEKYGTTIKHVEMIRDVLNGRTASLVEGAKLNIASILTRIEAKRKDVTRRRSQITRARNAIAREERRRRPDPGVIAVARTRIAKAEFAIHQYNRKIGILEHAQREAEARIARPALCFGSRDLLRSRAALDLPDAIGSDGRPLGKEGRVAAIFAWRAEWDRRRPGEVMLAGAASCADGNQFVRLVPVKNMPGLPIAWDVVIRLPRSLADLADRSSRVAGWDIHEAVVGRVRFPHGHDAFTAALGRGATPVTWRLQRHAAYDGSWDGSWDVRCTIRDEVPEIRDPTFAQGALGVDFNADHLAVTLTNGEGCYVRSWRIPLETAGLSSDATLDACRKAAKRVAVIARDHHVPVVAERLDFARRKAELRSIDGPVRARALHELAYAIFGAALESACARQGVRLQRVNPAYTSIIGFAKFAKPHGLSVHHAAACAIARRGQDFSERLPSRVRVHLTAGVHGTLPRPEVPRGAGIGDKVGGGLRSPSCRRHVWTLWSAVAKERKVMRRSYLDEAGNGRGRTDPAGRSIGHAVSKPPPIPASRTSAGSSSKAAGRAVGIVTPTVSSG